MTTQRRQIPNSDEIQLALGGRVHRTAIAIVQGIAKAKRDGRKFTDRWLMNFVKIQRSRFYELKRQLILAGYVDEDGSIYLPDAQATQEMLAKYALVLRNRAPKRLQPRGGTVRRTLITSLCNITANVVDMAAKYGVDWEQKFAQIPDRKTVCG